jgi:hypothetical protein
MTLVKPSRLASDILLYISSNGISLSLLSTAIDDIGPIDHKDKRHRE